MFFLISALLFGTKWAKDGYNKFKPAIFLKKRCLRIFLPLWFVLLFVVPIEYITCGRFEPTTIFMNFIGLNWARPFGSAGHLWYITMLMVLYVCFIVMSRFRLDKLSWRWWGIASVVVGILYLFFRDCLTTYSKAGPPLFIFFSSLIFAKGNALLEAAKGYKHWLIVLVVVAVGVSQYVYQLGWHDSHKALAIGSFIIAGFLSFVALYTNIYISKSNNTISWVAGISYEIYLVHAPLIAICHNYIKDKALWTIVWVVLSIATAVLLNKLSNSIIKKI